MAFSPATQDPVAPGPETEQRATSRQPLLVTALRRIQWSLVRWRHLPGDLVEWLIWFSQVLQVDQWVISGREATGGERLRLLYAGSSRYPANRAYLRKMIFNDACREHYLGKVWFWQRVHWEAFKEPACALEISETPRLLRALFRHGRSFFIPTWINGTADLSSPQVLPYDRYSFRWERRMIRKNQLSCQISTDPAQLRWFYETMYLPHISRVHQDGAVLASYDSLLREFGHGELLFVFQHGEAIGGALMLFERRQAHMIYMGIKDGDTAHVAEGAVGAIYYFGMLHARARGFTRVAFGWSRPFLKDGVLHYKKQRGLTLGWIYKMGFSVRVRREVAGARDFLRNHPFIFLDKRSLYGALFIAAGEALTEEAVGQYHADYFVPGLRALILCPLGSGDPPQEIPGPQREVVQLRRAEDLL